MVVDAAATPTLTSNIGPAKTGPTGPLAPALIMLPSLDIQSGFSIASRECANHLCDIHVVNRTRITVSEGSMICITLVIFMRHRHRHKAIDNFSRLGVHNLKRSKFIAEHVIECVNYLGVVYKNAHKMAWLRSSMPIR